MSASTVQPSPELFVEGLALVRGGRRLFAGIGFSLAAGEAVLLRGPNGAGKTSLLLTLCGVLRPDAGSIAWRGGDEAPALHLLLPQPGLKARLSVAENLRFWRAVNGANGLEVGPALMRVGLGGLGGIEAGHLSTGQLRRLALARLLITRRPVWLLDEPTSALDAEGEKLVAALLGEHLAEGGLALVATHHDIVLPAPATVRTLTLGAAA
jgi:heme exporter protein A